MNTKNQISNISEKGNSIRLKKLLRTALIAVSFLMLTNAAEAARWGNWISVGNGIEVSFKFSDDGCDGYSYARIRNVGYKDWDYVVVEYDRYCDGAKVGSDSITANDLKIGDIKEKVGDWFSADRLAGIRIRKIENFGK